MYTVLFQFFGHIKYAGYKPVLDDYSWWFDLVSKIVRQADRFEIRCWPEEPAAIATGRQSVSKLKIPCPENRFSRGL
ncbi:hypothetical protein [Thermoclostridium caenicola]|uniref:Uncharacterized protein n=1 Tax=Thermoclostridium caenicola TaxID=659425 RepID=A0A1M6HZ65_9FIRM|nr:hypothetical protein [Thermoclostridium caenicola]SHJ27433.1 hypothetical protein SAMN05444373_10379 [Thermoclostridium caenicola]